MKIFSRSELHLPRRIFHALGVLIIALIYNFTERKVALGLLVATLAIFLPLDFLRLRHPAFRHAAMTIFGKVVRRDELSRISGTSYLFVGISLLVYLFPQHVVTLTLLMFAVGDPAASICGILYGKDRLIGQKTLQGALGAFVACSLAACVYFLTQNLMTDRWILASLLAGLVGMISEIVPVGKLDDNLTFPILAGVLVWMMLRIFSGINDLSAAGVS